MDKIDASEWVPRQSIVFDWFDGPKHGICALRYSPSEFEFTCIGERLNPNGIDHKLYSIAELPQGTVDRIRELLEGLGVPLDPVWVPVWNFPSLDDQRKVEAEVDELLRRSKPTNLVIYTLDMRAILGCWRVDSLPIKADDLFDALGIPAAGKIT